MGKKKKGKKKGIEEEQKTKTEGRMKKGQRIQKEGWGKKTSEKKTWRGTQSRGRNKTRNRRKPESGSKSGEKEEMGE